jgi:glycosyltransferase involved in cell wall biosynthesis
MECLPQWYRRCRVHVNLTPSGFGDKVAWEAMACGRPSLLANAGFHETLGKYAEDLLFDPEDFEALASKLALLLAHSQREHDEIGMYLRQQVIRMHSLEGLASKLMSLFEAIKPQ